MLIQEFSFGNFKSYKNINTLNLNAAKIKSSPEELDKNNVIEINDEKILKSKAIYGANASGKSTVFEALDVFRLIVKYSHEEEDVLLGVIPFLLSTETKDEPTFFQLIFWIGSIRYRYGFEVSDKKIYSEWLFGKKDKREIPYFIRENDSIIKLDATNFNEGVVAKKLTKGETLFRFNSLYLSSLSKFGFATLSKIITDKIKDILVLRGIGDSDMKKFATEIIKSRKNYTPLLDFLKFADIGLEDVYHFDVVQTLKDRDLSFDTNDFYKKDLNEGVLMSVRNVYNSDLEVNGTQSFIFDVQESEGTKKLFYLSPYIITAIRMGKPIFIDEFDARFHPLITKKIVQLFHEKENQKGQLVFATHDSNLLSNELLRRDQIDFVEKDKYGESYLYSLVELKGVKQKASFEKDYILGKYGAIPYLGDFSTILKKE